MVSIDEVGNKKPRLISYNDKEYIIDRVIAVKSCASFKVGGIGERYTVRILGKETYLFYEMGRWFVEEKIVTSGSN